MQERFDRAMQNALTDEYHMDECKRIQRVALVEMGIQMSIADAEYVWRDHSASVAVGWLGMDTDEEIIQAIKEFITRYRYVPDDEEWYIY
jgi:hypothetical protein